jgi:hypothetical protein
MRSANAWIVATFIAAGGFITLSNLVGATGSPTGVGSPMTSRISWSVGALSAITFLVLSARALLARRSNHLYGRRSP